MVLSDVLPREFFFHIFPFISHTDIRSLAALTISWFSLANIAWHICIKFCIGDSTFCPFSSLLCPELALSLSILGAETLSRPTQELYCDPRLLVHLEKYLHRSTGNCPKSCLQR